MIVENASNMYNRMYHVRYIGLDQFTCQSMSLYDVMSSIIELGW